jgi:hypothetical protein
MSAHVDRNHVIVTGEVGGDVIERMRVAGNPVEHEQRRLRGVAPLQIVKTQTVHGGEPVDKRRRLERLGLKAYRPASEGEDRARQGNERDVFSSHLLTPVITPRHLP